MLLVITGASSCTSCAPGLYSNTSGQNSIHKCRFYLSHAILCPFTRSCWLLPKNSSCIVVILTNLLAGASICTQCSVGLFANTSGVISSDSMFPKLYGVYTMIITTSQGVCVCARARVSPCVFEICMFPKFILSLHYYNHHWFVCVCARACVHVYSKFVDADPIKLAVAHCTGRNYKVFPMSDWIIFKFTRCFEIRITITYSWGSGSTSNNNSLRNFKSTPVFGNF